MTSVEDRTAELNRLIRGELAAVETYRQALNKMTDGPEATELHALLTDHREALQTLREHVTHCGGKPSETPGLWGTWARLVEEAAQLFGITAALKALKQGEEHGIRDYEDVLLDPHLEPCCANVIRTDLLPRARAHVPVLEQLIDAQ